MLLIHGPLPCRAYINPDVGWHPDVFLLSDPPDRIVVVAIVVRDVKLPLSCSPALTIDPPHRLIELVDDDGDAADTGKRHDRIICSVGAEITCAGMELILRHIP